MGKEAFWKMNLLKIEDQGRWNAFLLEKGGQGQGLLKRLDRFRIVFQIFITIAQMHIDAGDFKGRRVKLKGFLQMCKGLGRSAQVR